MVCAYEDCPFRVYAGYSSARKCVIVSSVDEQHTCVGEKSDNRKSHRISEDPTGYTSLGESLAETALRSKICHAEDIGHQQGGSSSFHRRSDMYHSSANQLLNQCPFSPPINAPNTTRELNNRQHHHGLVTDRVCLAPNHLLSLAFWARVY
jgi:hypothetical protein